MGLVVATEAKGIAWACFGIGVGTLVVGLVIGLWVSLRRVPVQTKEAKTKLQEARTKIEETKSHIAASAAAASSLESMTSGAVASASAAQAGASADAATSALQQVEGIVSALPENLRFAGLLILVGTVLISVATVQFGGVSLF